ncbi:leucine-rich repeat domain-containing protein [Paenibacillus sp. GCM10028914]|uniref:leucine-rich repeat domain-containing protein n=1 Tax=Paenibacillus sp. GCM10028914 TaxID=3273416 RepID=UPI0036081144
MNITQDFIDERFKAYVLETFCDNRESIETSDVDHIVLLQLANQQYSSLKGIEHFTSLEELDCSRNHLIELDISSNRQLRTLNCGFNRIRNLDISQNNKLTKLECYWNIISELHVGQNEQLRELNCSYNALFDLNLDTNTRLIHLDCGNNHLISLNVEGCHNLIEIRCNHNHLTNLDVTGNSDLQSLRCFNNHIRDLDLSQNTYLEELYCEENKISKLDMSHNTKLERKNISNNLITEPDHVIKDIGTFGYDVSLSSYTFTFLYKGRELSVKADVPTEPEMKKLEPIIKKAWGHFDELNDQALGLIAEANPDEDVSELVLTELEFDRDSTFRLGYDAGDTPAGQLSIYVMFNAKLEVNSDLVYEVY